MSKTKDKKVEVREIVFSQDDDKSFGDIFVYEPENIEEQNLGNLFIVGELKDLPRNCSYIINLLASKIKKEFYSNTKRTAEESLEAGLYEANQTLSDLANQGNGEYVGKLSMVCGTYRGNKFYLSQIGKIKSLLIREGQLLEIIKEDSSKPISPKRVFNDIASGELEEGDRIIFATSGLFNIFSTEELRKIGSSLELDEFAENLQERVEQEDSEIVSALVIEIEGERKKEMNRTEITLNETENKNLQQDALALEENNEKEQLPEPTEKKEEENYLYEPESKTIENYPEQKPSSLGEAATIPAAGQTASLFDTNSTTIEENSETKKNKDHLVEKESKKISLSDIIKEYEKMEKKNTAEMDSEKDKNIEHIISQKEPTNFEDLDEQEGGLGAKISSRIKKYLAGINISAIKNANISGKAKKLFQNKKEYAIQGSAQKSAFAFKLNRKASLIIIIILFAAGTYYYVSSQQKEKETAKLAAYQSTLSESKSKMEQGEVELISGSKENAGKLFSEAKVLALKVKDEYDGLDAEAEDIISKAQTEIDKIDHVVKVDSSDLLANFDNKNIAQLVSIAGNYYTIDSKENSIYKIDSKNSTITQLISAEKKIGDIKFAQIFQNQEILLSDGIEFLSFNLKDNSIKKLDTKAEENIKGMLTYGRYVYLLAPSNNQIYKYQKGSSSLESKTEWIKGGDLQDAISFAIDQNIYILTDDGQVKKYFTGSEVINSNGSKFAIQQPSDAISSSSKIYTTTDQKYIYITESEKQRILIFDKTTGELIKQLKNEDFISLKDIYVDADEKTLLVLVDNKIIKINLTNLESSEQ